MDFDSLKDQNQRIVGPNYLKNLQKFMIFMKEPGFFNGYFIFSFFEESWLYLKFKSLIFLKILLMNPKNHLDIHHGYVLVSNNHATLVQTSVR